MRRSRDENLIKIFYFSSKQHFARPSETRMFFYCIIVLLRMGQTMLVIEQQLSTLSFVAFRKTTIFFCSGKVPTSCICISPVTLL